MALNDVNPTAYDTPRDLWRAGDAVAITSMAAAKTGDGVDKTHGTPRTADPSGGAMPVNLSRTALELGHRQVLRAFEPIPAAGLPEEWRSAVSPQRSADPAIVRGGYGFACWVTLTQGNGVARAEC